MDSSSGGRIDLIDHIVSLAEDTYKALRMGKLPPEWVQLDLTMPQLKILLLLHTDGQATVGQLASLLQVGMPTTSDLLSRLEQRGLVERERDEHDRRLVVCHLTPQGEDQASRLWELGRVHIARLLELMDLGQLQVVARALELLRDSARALKEDAEVS